MALQFVNLFVLDYNLPNKKSFFQNFAFHPVYLQKLPSRQSLNAARDLGISERTLYRKIKQYEIEE